MLLVYRKELRASLLSARGYILLAAQLLPLGLFVSLYHLFSLSADFSYTLSSMRWVLPLLIPAITLHARQTDEDRWLFSLPLSAGGILLGKFLAAWTLFAVPAAVALLYPLLLSGFGTLSLGAALSSWLGYLLLGTALTAICFYLSSLMKRPLFAFLLGAAVTAALCFLAPLSDAVLGAPWLALAVCILLSSALGALAWRVTASPVWGGILSALFVGTSVVFYALDAQVFGDTVSRMLLWADPFSRFGRFTYGYFHLPSAGLLLSCTAFFLYLSARRAAKRRRGLTDVCVSDGTRSPLAIDRARERLGLCAVTLLLAAALLAANLAVGALPSGVANLDLAKSETFLLSGRSRDRLAAVDQDVTLYLIADGARSGADGELLLFLERYADASARIRVRIVTEHADDGLAALLGGGLPASMSVVARVGDRLRVIDGESMFYYLYATESGSYAMSYSEYQTVLEGLLRQDPTGAEAFRFISAVTVRFCGESRLTNAILALCDGALSQAYRLTGNETAAIPTDLSERLWENGYDVHKIASLSLLPKDCELLLIHAIGADLSEADAAALEDYLAKGGRLLLTTYYAAVELPRLGAVLAKYGMKAPDGVHYLCEGDGTYLLVEQEGYESLIYAHVKEHAASDALTGRVVVQTAHSIEAIPTDGVTLTPILTTSEKAYRAWYSEEKKDFIPEETTGEHCFGMLAEAGTGSILWVASPYWMQADCNAYGEDGNYQLLLGAADFLTGNAYEPIALGDTAVFTGFLAPRASEAVTWSILLAAVLPIVTLAIGFTVSYRRKKR